MKQPKCKMCKNLVKKIGGVYCSPACYKKDRIPKKISCQKCDKRFVPHHNTSKYCSVLCRDTAKARKKKACKGCSKVFIPHDTHTRYCSVKCYQEKIQPKEKVMEPTNIHLRSKVQSLEMELREQNKEEGRILEMQRNVAAAVTAERPPKFQPYKLPSGKKQKKPVTAVIMFSDWHIGEVVRAAELEGFGGFAYAFARDYLEQIQHNFLKWVDLARRQHRIDELVVLCLGDFISGDIHRELSVTNEFPVPVQTAKAGLLLGQMILGFTPHFKIVRVIEVGADNHSRLNPKPQFKQKATNSFSYLVYTIANAHLERAKNVKIEFAEGIKYRATIANFVFLCEHGDTVKAWMGIPYYGMERVQGREARWRMSRKEASFHYQAIAHWHVPGIIAGNIFVNGSLCGTTEFDHAVGRFAQPSQVSFLVHPRHGVFNWCAWKPEFPC